MSHELDDKYKEFFSNIRMINYYNSRLQYSSMFKR